MQLLDFQPSAIPWNRDRKDVLPLPTKKPPALKNKTEPTVIDFQSPLGSVLLPERLQPGKSPACAPSAPGNCPGLSRVLSACSFVFFRTPDSVTPSAGPEVGPFSACIIHL
jgi:hypothetical protein